MLFKVQKMIPYPLIFMFLILSVSCTLVSSSCSFGPLYITIISLSSFSEQDMEALINKINKSIVAPLPTMYTGALWVLNNFLWNYYNSISFYVLNDLKFSIRAANNDVVLFFKWMFSFFLCVKLMGFGHRCCFPVLFLFSFSLFAPVEGSLKPCCGKIRNLDQA